MANGGWGLTTGWGVDAWGGGLVSGGGSSGPGGPGGCECGGGPAPVVQNFQPSAGTPIQRGTPLTFDVIFSNTLVAIIVTVVYAETGATEVVYDKNGFSSNFATSGDFIGSERQNISGGWHFIIRRRAGWPLSPSIVVQGADSDGQSIVE